MLQRHKGCKEIRVSIDVVFQLIAVAVDKMVAILSNISCGQDMQVRLLWAEGEIFFFFSRSWYIT
jgi:hypothetical protein